MSGVFTIGASAPFAETLAQGLAARLNGDPLALSGAIIYLPTRRAARNFGAAFAGVAGGAALLPQFRALGDADEDELLLDDELALPPAITPCGGNCCWRTWCGAGMGRGAAGRCLSPRPLRCPACWQD